MDLMDLVKSQLSGDLLENLTKQIGAQDSNQTAAAANGVLGTLTAALAKNAQDPKQAESLNQALERDNHGNLMDMVGDLIGGNAGADNRAANGAGILKHILGEKKGNASSMISQMSGLSQDQTGSLMEKLAPLVMGALGKQKQEQGLDSSGLSSMLGGLLNNQQQGANSNPIIGMASKFLDKDGDGDIKDDLMGMLGGFLKR